MRPATIYAVIAIVTFGLFAPVNLHDFVEIGDERKVLYNAHVTDGLTIESAMWALGTETGSAWRPLEWISLQASHDVHGRGSAGPWALTNLALHIAASLLLLAALASMTGAFWPSAFVSAVYAVHPLQVETVAWVSARGEALGGLFYVTALVLWAAWTRRGGVWRYACALLAFGLGLASTGGLIAFPFLLLVLDVWPLGRVPLSGIRTGVLAEGPALSLRGALLEKLPFFAIAMGVALIGFGMSAAQPNSSSVEPPLLERCLSATASIADSLQRVLWPTQMAFTHPTHWQMGLGWPIGQAAIGLVLAIGVSLGAWRAGARGRPILAGWLWFVVLVIPASGIVPTGLRMLHDRYLQLALVGPAIAIAFSVADVLRRVSHRQAIASTLAILALSALGALSRQQVHTWRQSAELFDHALAVNELDAMARYYKGMSLARGQFESAAIDQFERAVEIQPLHANANLSLGYLLIERDESSAAVPHLERAVAGLPDSAYARMELARALLSSDRGGEGIVMLEELVAEDPTSAESHYRLGQGYEATGQTGLALASYQQAVELDPAHGVARAHRSRLLRRAAASDAEAGPE